MSLDQIRTKLATSSIPVFLKHLDWCWDLKSLAPIVLLRCINRKGDNELRALCWNRVDMYCAAMKLNNSVNQRETNSMSLDLLIRICPVKRSKYFVYLIGGKARAIVAKRYQ
jgi:hypothetical protein